jgi:hypothetical protein
MSREQMNLEGEYIGFTFLADNTRDSALKIYQTQGKELQTIWDPCDHAPIDQVGDYLDDLAIEELQRRGIKRIYTPGDGSFFSRRPVATFMDNPLSWQHDDYNWGIYKPLDDYYKNILREATITLHFLGDSLTRYS